MATAKMAWRQKALSAHERCRSLPWTSFVASARDFQAHDFVRVVRSVNGLTATSNLFFKCENITNHKVVMMLKIFDYDNNIYRVWSDLYVKDLYVKFLHDHLDEAMHLVTPPNNVIVSAFAGHVASVIWAINNGADVHAREDEALRRARLCNNAGVVCVLLQYGAK